MSYPASIEAGGDEKSISRRGEEHSDLGPVRSNYRRAAPQGVNARTQRAITKKLEAEELTEHGVEPSRTRTCNLVDEVDTNQKDR